SAGDFWHDHARRSAWHGGSEPAGEGDVRSPAGPGRVGGRLSEFVSAPAPSLSRSCNPAGEYRHPRRGGQRRQPSETSLGPRPMPETSLPVILPALPEIILVVGAMVLLLVGAFSGERSTRMVSWLAIAVLVIALVVSQLGGGERRLAFYGMFVTEAFALF